MQTIATRAADADALAPPAVTSTQTAKQWIDRCVRRALGVEPEDARDPVDASLRLIATAHIAAIVLCIPNALIWSTVVSPWFAVVYAAAASAWAGSLYLLRHTRRPRLAGRTGCAILYLLCTACALLLRETNGAAVAYLLIVPVAAGIASTRRDVWAWYAVCSATAIGLDLLGSGVDLHSAGGTAKPLSAAISLVVAPAMLVIAVLSSTLIAAQRRLERRLDRELDDARDEAANREILVLAAQRANAESSFHAAAEAVAPLIASIPHVESVAIWDARLPGSALARVAGAGTREGEDHECGSIVPVTLSGPDAIQIDRETGRCCVRVRGGSQDFGVVDVSAETIDQRLQEALLHVASHLAHVGTRELAATALLREASEDQLTRLPNRRAFLERLTRVLEEADQENRLVALLFLDLDGFKRINDSLGHAAGDAVLQVTARRLQRSIRLSDEVFRGSGTESSVARLGGDEFTILLDEVSSADDGDIVARRVIEMVEKPIRYGEHELRLRASVGIALYPEDAASADQLVHRADSGMYEAKKVERSAYRRIAVASAGPNVLELEAELRTAISERQLRFHLQPIIDARTGEIAAAELLARWQHPERGCIAAGEFIPFAERHGMMTEIGGELFESACDWLAASQASLPEGFRLAMNVSPRQIEDSDFVVHVATRLARGDIPVSQLEFEITETALIEDSPELNGHLCALNGIGIHFSLDDFGTGYSSLSLVKRFPISRLKIDRSFVQGLPDDPEDLAIVAATLSMAESLGLSVVGEGIEDEAQQEFLCARGCDELQGFLLGKPMPPEDFLNLIESRRDARRHEEDPT